MDNIKIHCAFDKMLPITELKPHHQNRNKHPSEQIDRLAKIIKYQGIRSPIKVSRRSNLITAGHGRLEAFRRLKLKEVPVNFQDYESDEQEYADLQSDNAVALWAELDLSGINTDIAELGPDFDIDLLGIKDFVLEPAEKFDPKCDEDEVLENIETRSKLGDRWLLSDHILVCGDSTDICAVDLLMANQKADMVFTDPPYGIDVVKSDGNVGGNRINGKVDYGKNAHKYGAKAKCGTYKAIIGDNQPFEPGLLLTLAPHQIIWGANNFASKLPDNSHWIVWYKNMPDNDFSGAELAWTSIDKKTVKTYAYTWAGMTRKGNRRDELTKRVHPTQKPVGLFEAILNDYNPKSVIDLYGGSGSTLIACEKTNRKCFMMEIDPHYCDIILARWEKYTGKEAKLDGASQT